MTKKYTLILLTLLSLWGCKSNVIAYLEEDVKVINQSSLQIDSIATFDLIDGQRKTYKINHFDQAVLSTRNQTIRSINSRFQLIDTNGKILFDTIPNIAYPDQMYKHTPGDPMRQINMTLEFRISEFTEFGSTKTNLHLKSTYYWLNINR